MKRLQVIMRKITKFTKFLLNYSFSSTRRLIFFVGESTAIISWFCLWHQVDASQRGCPRLLISPTMWSIRATSSQTCTTAAIRASTMECASESTGTQTAESTTVLSTTPSPTSTWTWCPAAVTTAAATKTCRAVICRMATGMECHQVCQAACLGEWCQVVRAAEAEAEVLRHHQWTWARRRVQWATGQFGTEQSRSMPSPSHSHSVVCILVTVYFSQFDEGYS